MRTFNHRLAASQSGKSVLFRVKVSDRDGERMMTFSSVKGWRAELAKRYLMFDSDEWNDSAVRTFVGLNALGASRDRIEAVHYIDTVRSMGSTEAHFWASKFLTANGRARSAWGAFYREK